MEQLKSVEYITIDGKKYNINSSAITRDYFNNEEWIIKDYSIKLVKHVHIHPLDGVIIREWVYTKDANKAKHSDYIFYIKTVNGTYYAIKDYILTGGQLYPSINEDTPYILYDETLNKKMNNKDKFREFNNCVSCFKDIDNPLLSLEEKKAILDRDIYFGVRTLTNKIFEGLNYTFGVELETSKGRVTEKEAEGLNLMCEFDGSLREFPDQNKSEVLGGEYVTGILVGDAGMHHLQKICNVLSEKCSIGPKCGVHVHVGNLKFTKENIVYMYILGEILQNEIYALLPLSRRNNVYCKKLKNLDLSIKQLKDTKTPILYKILINEYYRSIFKEVQSVYPSKKNNKLTNHPNGSKCGYNKDSQRYSWLNFVPAICNTRSNTEAYTLEFRPMYATLNYIKVKHWIKLCVAFVNFAENHQSSIKRGFWIDREGNKLSINLSTIIKAAYPRTGKILEEYIEEKKNYFLLDNGQVELFEYQNDKQGVKNLTIKECV